MKQRLALLGCLLVCCLVPVWLMGQGITVTDPSKSWTATVPEPPIPKVAAGQSFVSFFGHKVTRITDQRTAGDGGSFVHYYSDRSPLSRNSNYLSMMGPGGSGWIQPMRNGAPSGAPWMIYVENQRPISIGMTMWSPVEDETLYFIGDQTELWSINARTRKKKLIRDFRKELSKSKTEGHLLLQFLSKDGKRFMMDYQQQSKFGLGIVVYDLSTNAARVYLGDRVQKKTPPFANPTFRLAGSGADKDGAYFFVQENGQPINPQSANPQESASTYTYIVKWDDDPLQGPAQSLAGLLTVNHGAVLSKGHVRISNLESGYINNVDWLFSLRRADLTRKPDPADQFRYPGGDLFFWPTSSGGGAHLSSGLLSDDWLALSLYQIGSCGQRLMKPMSNEIVMISTKSEAKFDDKSHQIVKNGEMHRLTHHFSYPEDCAKPVSYWGQPRASLSMDGKYVVFTSTLGRTGRTDLFVATLPKYLTPSTQ